MVTDDPDSIEKQFKITVYRLYKINRFIWYHFFESKCQKENNKRTSFAGYSFQPMKIIRDSVPVSFFACLWPIVVRPLNPFDVRSLVGLHLQYRHLKIHLKLIGCVCLRPSLGEVEAEFSHFLHC